jgi:DNA-binding CsgD family transcriptional regulator
MAAQVFGRDAELEAIGAFLGALPRSPGAVVLAGAAGAGKTTVLGEGARLAAGHGFTVLRTFPARGDFRLAFAGLADLLEPCLDAVVGELPAPQARALRVALLLAEAPAHPPEPRLIAAALRTALGVLARSAPVLVVIDDVQWLDLPTQAAVGFTVRRLEHEAVGLLCAQRTAGPGEELPLELGRARLRAEVLTLGGLSIGALHRLLRVRLGVSFSHPALRRIEAGSGGNAFIALEIGRALARRGSAVGGSAVLPVPGTLSGLVEERLGELPPAVLDALRLVAVMPGAAAAQYAAAGAGGAELDAAVVAGVLEPVAGRLRFSHPLLGSAVAGSIPPGRLRELHAVAAGMAVRPEERARHRALAAAGPSAVVAAELDAAARAAAGRGAPATAAELFELAASVTPAQQRPDASRRLLDSARQLAFAGDRRAAAALLEALIASAPAGPARADALSLLGWLRQDEPGAEAAALLGQALAEAGADPVRTAGIRLTLADYWSDQGDQVRSRAEARQALADAERAGDPALLAASLAATALSAFLCGGSVDERLLGRALELERAAGSGLLGRSYAPSWVAGYCYLAQGRLEDAQARLRQVLGMCDSDGNELWRVGVLLRLSRLAAYRGDLREAAVLAAEGLECAEQVDRPHTVGALLCACGEAAGQLGQADTVRDLAGRAAQAAGETGDRAYLEAGESLQGTLDLALGDYAAAAQRLRPLAARWRATSRRVITPTSIAPKAVEALTGAGELQEAGSLVAEMERDARSPLAAAVTARCRGGLAAARGDLGAAVTELTEALRLQELISPMPLERGRVLLMLGGIQRRLKQRSAARVTLSEASRIFERTGAPLWAARARAELARVSGRAPGPDELTVTELRTAELVGRGLSNTEIAAELFVTVRAVESTLTKAYAKLGVRTRTELAARLHRSADARPAARTQPAS